MNEKNVEMLKAEKRHDFASLLDIMRLLRSENGCPWDKEQTHATIRSNFIEETYEVVEAIDNKDAALMREELGDVLLQVVFHARISEENGEFTMDDVIHDICAKLIHRHPHIFGDVQADTSEIVLNNWEKIKTEEKKRIGLSGTLESIPPALPSLMKIQKFVKKAAKEDLAPSADAAVDKFQAAAQRLSEQTESLERTLQDLLVSSAVLAQANGIDTEELLYKTCCRITEKVRTIEEACCGDLSSITEPSRDELAKQIFYAE